jgi:hypothetical protein
MKSLEALSSVTIALLFTSAILFVTSELAQLAIKALTLNLLIVTIGLSAAYLVLSYTVTRLSSNRNKCKTV